MDDTMDEDEATETQFIQSAQQGPADWVSTDNLECEVWNAIADDCATTCDEVDVGSYDEIGEPSSVEDEFADEAEERGCLFRQLTRLRPHLAELLGEGSCTTQINPLRRP